MGSVADSTLDREKMREALLATAAAMVATCHCCGESEMKLGDDRPRHWARVYGSTPDRKQAIKWYLCPVCIRKMYC